MRTYALALILGLAVAGCASQPVSAPVSHSHLIVKAPHSAKPVAPKAPVVTPLPTPAPAKHESWLKRWWHKHHR